MFNVKDLPELEAKLVEAYKVRNDSEEQSEAFEELIQKITGPNTGLSFNDETLKLEIEESFMQDVDGNILHRDKHTGPATGMEVRDDKIQPID